MKYKILNELQHFIHFKSTQRKWHIPLFAAICVGIPLLTGLYLQNLQYGLIACISGMVILYLPASGPTTTRIITILVSSFGFMASFSFGLIFSFHVAASIIAFGVFSFLVHLIVLYYKTSPPRSFFFILIASMAISQPFEFQEIPTKVGLIGLGTIFTSLIALAYVLWGSLCTTSETSEPQPSALIRNIDADFWEAIIMGIFMTLALGIGRLLKFENPYWIPISTAAVMQGASRYHIWQRSIHRISGTFIGLGLCWLLLEVIHTPLSLCMAIIVLQFVIEILISRNYALAVIFITPMTILLAEATHPLFNTPSTLIYMRFIDILIGSLIGALGGWVLHKEKIRYATMKKIKDLRAGLIKL